MSDNTKQGNMNIELQNRRHRTVANIMLIIIIILILLLLRQCSGAEVLNPDYPPVSDDPYASEIPGDNGEKLEHEEGGGAVSIELQDNVTIDLSDKMVYLHFANPGRSTQDMMMQIEIQGEILVQSGRIRPGYQVKQLDLLKNAEKKLKKGIYEGTIKLYYYNPENNERAMIDTRIPVDITVRQ